MFGNLIFIFDFDSTFTQVEALDVLADIALIGATKDSKLKKIADLTQKGMSGNLSFSESLSKRMKILNGSKSDISTLIKLLKEKVSDSITANKDFFNTYKNNIYIVSSGFKEFIIPVVAEYNIAADHVFANDFIWKNNSINGYDTANPLSKTGGKPTLVASLQFKNDVVVIGDGYTDYEIKKAGFAKKFVAFTENVSRPNVTKHADFIASNFNDFLNYITNEKTLLPKA